MTPSMTPPPPGTDLPGTDPSGTGEQTSRPRTRAERQRETRAALVESALVVFARDGYHGANLELIANHAGYSKGAVYSNFDGKAQLFFAVMDRNLAAMQGEGWDPFGPALLPAPTAMDTLEDGPADLAELMRGLGLATLEFIATAARDELLSPALTRRAQVLLDAFRGVAADSPADGEPLAPEEVAVLLSALDQGFAVLGLLGIVAPDSSLLRTGLRRLLDPARAVITGPAPVEGSAHQAIDGR